jgi:hypothetical protein
MMLSVESGQLGLSADHVLALDSTEGLVVGVLGPWGSGKTSFVNLARGRLQESGVTILEFNPWMFAGADQLVQAFFVELSAQLKIRPDLAEIGRVQDVISSLEVYEDQWRPEHVVPATVVLLNLLPALPERQGGMFELNTRWVVGRVVYRLVRALKDPQATEIAVREILSQVPSLSSKLELITDVGYREGAGHKLVPKAVATALEQEWRTEVRATCEETLAREPELLRTLIRTKRDAGPDEPALVIPDSPSITHALLKSARSEVTAQSFGSRAVHRTPRLSWSALVELFGDEAILCRRIEALKTVGPDDIGDLLELAGKYLAGWRSSDFDE